MKQLFNISNAQIQFKKLILGLSILSSINAAIAASIVEYPTEGTATGLGGFTISGGYPNLLFTESGNYIPGIISISGRVENPFTNGAKIGPDGQTNYSPYTSRDNPREILSLSGDAVFYTTSNGIVIGKEGSYKVQYLLPPSSSAPSEPTLGNNNEVWFVETAANKIGKYSSSSTSLYPITEYNLSSQGVDKPINLVFGSDGNLWFIDLGFNTICKMTSEGVVTKFPFPTGVGLLMKGPGGHIWFRESSSNNIGKITPTGMVTEYPISPNGNFFSGSGAKSMVLGPDGNAWFVEYQTNKIGKITLNGVVTEYALPTQNSLPLSIVAGFNDDLWFTEVGTNKIGKITVTGELAEYEIPTTNSRPINLFAFNGGIWFTEGDANKLAVIYDDNYVDADRKESTLGEAVTFTAHIKSDQGSGLVSFFYGGNQIPLVNGQASFTTSNLKEGTNNIWAFYSTGPNDNKPKPLGNFVHVVKPVGSTVTPTVTPSPTPTITPTPVATAAIPATEREALVAFYNATNGGNWSNKTGWLGAVGSECHWFGVTCNLVGNHVTSINLDQNQLGGYLPDSLAQLAFLQELVITNSQLSGKIPASLAQLSQLVRLSLAANQLSGTIPAELGQLKKLKFLELFNNKLEGKIADSLGQLSLLQKLWLGNNMLTGNIPDSLGQLSNLQELMLAYTQLSGSIPASLGQLARLQSLYLNNSQLNGNIPDKLGNLTRLHMLELTGNHLVGTIPSALGQLFSLQHLGLSGNQLTGNIPAELGQLSQLKSLFINENQLSGKIPDALGQLVQLTSLDLSRNKLSGSLPAVLWQLKALETLDLGVNQLSGSIPKEVGQLNQLNYLSFSENYLSGIVPSTLLQLTKLTLFDLGHNCLTTTDPTLLAFIIARDNNWSVQDHCSVPTPIPTVVPTPTVTAIPTPPSLPDAPVISVSPAASAAPGTAMTLSITSPHADVSYQLCYGNSTGKYGSTCMPIKSSFSFKMPPHLDIYGAVKAINAQGKSSALSNELHVTATDDDVTWDESTHTAGIRDVKVGATHYRVKLILTGNPYFGLQSTEILNTPLGNQPANYDDNKQDLTIPLAQVNGRYYQVTLHNIGKYSFRLDRFDEIK